jgi:hypothetical protein
MAECANEVPGVRAWIVRHEDDVREAVGRRCQVISLGANVTDVQSARRLVAEWIGSVRADRAEVG